jgi:uncharacterized membrane protein YesL
MNRFSFNLYEFDALRKVSDFILANLLWVLFAIPLVTLPAATAGLFATLGPWIRGKSAAVIPDFFQAMRSYWLKSTLIVAIDLGLGLIIAANLLILYSMGLPQIPAVLSLGVTLSVMLVTILANLYIWPTMVVFDLSFKQLIQVSISMAFRHLGWTILTLAGVVLILGLSIRFLPRFFLVFAAFSGCALIMCWGQWRVARRYVEPDELARLEAPQE